MLIDAHSLIYRAYFALIETPLSTSKGQLVNAAFGFWSIVLRGFQDAQPDHVICCFDVGRPKRADMYGAYKGTRRPTPDDLRDQFPIVRETLAAFLIPIFDLDGYEADDLIGTLSLQAQEQGIDSVIVSGDLDISWSRSAPPSCSRAWARAARSCTTRPASTSATAWHRDR